MAGMSRHRSRPTALLGWLPRHQPGPPRFSITRLGRLQETESGVGCECLNHLAGLVSTVQAFEAYALECAEHEGQAHGPVHRQIIEEAARARAILEGTLATVCRAAGLDGED